MPNVFTNTALDVIGLSARNFTHLRNLPQYVRTCIEPSQKPAHVGQNKISLQVSQITRQIISPCVILHHPSLRRHVLANDSHIMMLSEQGLGALQYIVRRDR